LGDYRPDQLSLEPLPRPGEPRRCGRKNLERRYRRQHLLAGGRTGTKIGGRRAVYYGRGWRGVGSANNGLYQSANGEYEAGIDNYNVLVSKPGTVYRSPVTKQMWKYDGNEFWSYDDPEVLTTKMNYIKERGLGGSMAWSMDDEDKAATLSKTIYNALK